MAGVDNMAADMYFKERAQEVWTPVETPITSPAMMSGLHIENGFDPLSLSSILMDGCVKDNNEFINVSQENSLVLIISILCSGLRGTRRPAVKLTIIRLLSCLAPYTTDEVRLQRMVPYVISLVSDGEGGSVQRHGEVTVVRAFGIKLLTKVCNHCTI